VPRQRNVKDETQSYEALTERLRQVVERLEAGELPLAEALALYEEGVSLSARCQQLLDSAELRVQQLLVGEDGVNLTPMSDA
jgi:exodeoxyribonuclease VII small subunit